MWTAARMPHITKGIATTRITSTMRSTPPRGTTSRGTTLPHGMPADTRLIIAGTATSARMALVPLAIARPATGPRATRHEGTARGAEDEQAAPGAEDEEAAPAAGTPRPGATPPAITPATTIPDRHTTGLSQFDRSAEFGIRRSRI
jgi:hypothetical protein